MSNGSTAIWESKLNVSTLLSLPTALIVILFAPAAWGGSLHGAARNGDMAAVDRLIMEGADIEAVDEETALTPLVEAALAGRIDMVVFLIDKGADAGGRDGNGFTALHAAAHMGYADIAELLIQRGIDINDQQNVSTVTPLHLAAERDYRVVAELLLRQGAEIDLKTESGHTPVILAALNTHADMVKLLREHGASCSFRSKRFSDYCMHAGN